MVKRADHEELLGEHPRARLETDLTAALRRKPAHEVALGGALRVLAPYSAQLRTAIGAALATMVKRGSFARPLYAALVRTAAEGEANGAANALNTALLSDDAGGLATLSAACFTRSGTLTDALARVASNRHPHLAFAAEVARVARGEADGAHVASLAPMIKESYRIALCVEMFVPLLWHDPMPLAIAPALSVLCEAERHLGRWLVLADIAVRAGDRGPLERARENARSGPSSARAAWAMVAWALAGGHDPVPGRPTVELVARLSDRPSADRDPTFLFRLAEARAPVARPMLEALVKTDGPLDANGARAAFYLARDHGRDDLREQLHALARHARGETSGLAVAALYDTGDGARAQELAAELVTSRQLATSTWASLVQLAAAGQLLTGSVIAEPSFRRVQLGWLE